ncbi:MAG TPA: 16S rRNA (cytosine(1402)-N(4))-methyltransferase, partial [Verrucomicrobia subdivision 3 bacterium]|nr:16S rRNA (cytosine(1402)-N(4))-methyltransferase [Limisphaerales bacterium]
MPEFIHKSVMAAEVLAALKPRADGRYADGTLGGAGHAAQLLAASSPTGWLSGCDRDGVAVEAAQKRLAEKFTGRFEIRRGNFSEMAGWIPAVSCNGVLLDLGVSSPQLDSAERGFSFQNDGPLDMR